MAAPAARAMKSPRLIEAVGHQDSGAGQVPAFCGQAGYGPSWLLKEIRGRPFRCGAGRRVSEGKTPRVYGTIRKASAAPRREISAAHRSCGVAGFRS
ncbi:hypothetical protein P9738_20475 [Bacillus siamensis]|uniref:hypothetical protein n=1 Tax=Bacillus siamensis TaxID=659243 RepID=UPI002E1DC698|nr:hypothetical protein [Bacillus siamensis]